MKNKKIVHLPIILPLPPCVLPGFFISSFPIPIPFSFSLRSSFPIPILFWSLSLTPHFFFFLYSFPTLSWTTMVEDVCFLYKVLPFYFLVASFYCQICMFFFICMLTPFSHFSLLLLLLLLLFFSFSLLNYNGRRRVFIYAEKVEEHIKAVIQNFFWCSAFILFSDFSQYKSLNFFLCYWTFSTVLITSYTQLFVFSSFFGGVMVQYIFWHVVCREGGRTH